MSFIFNSLNLQCLSVYITHRYSNKTANVHKTKMYRNVPNVTNFTPRHYLSLT